MAAERQSMRHIRELLRLHYSQRRCLQPRSGPGNGQQVHEPTAPRRPDLAVAGGAG